ncbi:Ig-like domain-containing surface protein [Desulfosporosinus acidiphilus SJ4]|uniref:Ig-like domain-containing surface protein n=1 Tax=Desulfosporosinus acidiphilus (strain DSM 22704 / JCM 16185 / SJ4) TaxID=646529 RepID=I4DBM1_DESAJ|nr:Ig-like domain-containing surface protein [Desulfosporosinus acidiphilus SJ4]
MRKLLLGLIVLLSIFAFPGVTLADTMQTAANLTDLQSLIYQDMVDRETPFEIKYTGDVQTLENGNLMSTMNKASTQDDYLALSFSDIQYNANVISKYDTVLTFTVSYITTKAEEDFVTSQAQSIVSSIITPGMTPDEKEKAIHDYITSHVSYDYSLQYHSAYDALTYGRAVCQGYAMLMEKMLNDAGIKTIIIKGYLNGNQPEDFHAWNMVQLNGFWYQVDATNDGVLNNLFYNVTDIFLSQHGFTWDKTKFPQAATLYSSSGSVIGIALSKTMDTIAVGSNDTLVTTITPSNATNQAVTWKSSNPSVATVDQNGKVLAINGGTATITVTTQDGNKSASCHVTVPNSATNIALSPASTTIDVGFTKSLSVVFRPSATTDKKVTWSSDNTSVAAVDTNGNVKGIADGSANITAKSDDGGFVATCAVTVQTGVTKIVLSKTTDTINVGNNDTLVAAITPSNATSQAVTWKSSNPSVATVDQNGKVVAVKTGTTVISVAAQDGNKVASCQVTVPNLASSIALNLTSTTIDVGFTQSLKRCIYTKQYDG